MEINFIDRNKSLFTALREAGLKVDEVQKKDKKTIITVVSPKKDNRAKTKDE